MACRHAWNAVLALTLCMHVPASELSKETFKIPEYTEEESMSASMPAEHKCSACHAIAYQLGQAFQKSEHDKNRKLKSSELIDLLETVACAEHAFENIGLKVLQESGQRVLSGPGIESDGVGMIQGGGKWPNRLAARCRAIAGDVGEEEVYALWRKHRDNGNREGDGIWPAFLSTLCVDDCQTTKTARKPRRESPKGRNKLDTPPSKGKLTKSLEPLSGPSLVDEVTKSTFIKLVESHQFVLMMVCAEPSPLCEKSGATFELAARAAARSKDLAKVKFALAKEDIGFGDVPFLFFRRGYQRPKRYNGRHNDELDFLHWLHSELPLYMKDDPIKFPRENAKPQARRKEL